MKNATTRRAKPQSITLTGISIQIPPAQLKQLGLYMSNSGMIGGTTAATPGKRGRPAGSANKPKTRTAGANG